MSSVQESSRVPWNHGRMIGPKPPLKPKHIWAIRTRLQHEDRVRDPNRRMNRPQPRQARRCPVSGGPTMSGPGAKRNDWDWPKAARLLWTSRMPKADLSPPAAQQRQSAAHAASEAMSAALTMGSSARLKSPEGRNLQLGRKEGRRRPAESGLGRPRGSDSRRMPPRPQGDPERAVAPTAFGELSTRPL